MEKKQITIGLFPGSIDKIDESGKCSFKEKVMKVAIPTNDGLNVCDLFRRSRGFAIATIEDAKVIHTEVRWNLLSEILTSERGQLYNICDCKAVIVNEIGICFCKMLNQDKIEVVPTKKTLISEAVSNYCEHLAKN